jgi:AcrR family transcriptional regulator
MLQDKRRPRHGTATVARSGAHTRALIKSRLSGNAPLRFRSADVNAILAAAGVTKGALYHHFENKEALGYAVVDEVIASRTREKWA